MLKFLIFIAAAVILWKLFTGDKQQKKAAEKQDIKRKAATGQMVKDPMCGTYVSKDAEIRVRDGEHVYHFCSYECRDKFLKQVEAGKKSIEE